MDTNRNAGFTTISKLDCLHKAHGLTGKLNNSYRVMASKEPRIKILLAELQTTASNERLSNCIDNLQAKLLTKSIQSIVYFLE